MTEHRIALRPFEPEDTAACLDMLDTNVPEFFAESEREDYRRFLKRAPSNYRVYHSGGRVVAACGLNVNAARRRGRIQWIMTDASARGLGLGGHMMHDMLEQALAENLEEVDISASQKSAPFFARFGAREVSRAPEGWGPGLDRVEMVLSIG